MQKRRRPLRVQPHWRQRREQRVRLQVPDWIRHGQTQKRHEQRQTRPVQPLPLPRHVQMPRQLQQHAQMQMPNVSRRRSAQLLKMLQNVATDCAS